MEHNMEDCSASGGHSCCDKSTSDTVAVRQTLTEMEFERGIWYAAQNNDIDGVEKFLKKGISPNIQDGAGYTALHYASRGGHWEICDILLKNGANVDAVTRCGNATSLHRSSMRGARRIVELLLKSGGNPNIRDSDGYIALHRAIIANSPSVCRLLIPVTDLTIRDNKSRNPEELARELDNLDIIDLFEKFVKT